MSSAQLPEALREASESDLLAMVALLQIRQRLGTRPGTAVVEIRNGELTVFAVAMSPERVQSQAQTRPSRLSF